LRTSPYPPPKEGETLTKELGRRVLCFCKSTKKRAKETMRVYRFFGIFSKRKDEDEKTCENIWKV
jgi:hypothetical protein